MGSCSRCHNQQSRFVYNWLDYKTAYADRWEIRRRVWDSWKGSYYKEPMPIVNSPESLSLSDRDRQTIRDWVAAGSPLGVAPVDDGTKSKADRIVSGQRLFTFARLPSSQWRSARTTNAIERLHEEFKRRIKTQTVLPSADTAAMLFWALLASGQINMRKVDGWHTLAATPLAQPIDLAA